MEVWSHDTPSPMVPDLDQGYVANQSSEVDVVSGATYTSNGVMNVKDAEHVISF